MTESKNTELFSTYKVSCFVGTIFSKLSGHICLVILDQIYNMVSMYLHSLQIKGD
jgi:hypothetical protein